MPAIIHKVTESSSRRFMMSIITATIQPENPAAGKRLFQLTNSLLISAERFTTEKTDRKTALFCELFMIT